METICRAITFINYHIPLSMDQGELPQYTTTGFFDGMFTEKLFIEYERQDLKNLWKYNVRKTAESCGKFSYQNIFGFSLDSWNQCTDEEFWAEQADTDYPLLFVVFLQLSDYMADNPTIEQQCRNFNRILCGDLGEEGRYYTYHTIDKNDFVVCIRTRNHTQALNVIKKLHNTESSVVYSYSVLSVSNRVLDEIRDDVLLETQDQKYPYLFKQYVDSICLKGITNSFNPNKNITLDQRYYEFCNSLIDKLYPAEEKAKPENERAYRIYDILGDDDFRLIARAVNLGKLLGELGVHGQLGNYSGDLRFYLYSSSLVLNTKTISRQDHIDSSVRENTLRQMDESLRTPHCEWLSEHMGKIIETLQDDGADEKKITFCQALWQLLQSLKVLESAPTKKYDFYSLYPPFASLVRILESKMNQPVLTNNREIYEFIHKISMTLHGTLRTDIQFFQIRDFNVTIHYAPAKLRAFYAIWALKLSEFYNSFKKTEKKYSFILSPGVFGQTHVKQLFKQHEERERLMLITTPERNLYIPRWLNVIIAHEISHFVGTEIREREFRHKILLRISSHIATLEMLKFFYVGMPDDLVVSTEKMMKSTYLRNWLKRELVNADEQVCMEEQSPYLYHSDMSKEIICRDYRYVSNNERVRPIIYNYGGYLQRYLLKAENVFYRKDGSADVKRIVDICNERTDKMLIFFEKFKQVLPELIDMLHYICKETFADIIAILTLALSPADYVKSFVRSDCLNNDQDWDQKTTNILSVRIAVTMEAVETIIYKNQEWLSADHPKMIQEWLADYDPKVDKSWKGTVIRATIFKLHEEPTAQNIMVNAYGYRKNLTSKKNSIRNYKSMYNPDYQDETFSFKRLDFLNDINIYKFLCIYMDKCASTYFERLEKDDHLRKMWTKLLYTYQVLADGDIVQIMQEIECFLKEHEESWTPGDTRGESR